MNIPIVRAGRALYWCFGRRRVLAHQTSTAAAAFVRESPTIVEFDGFKIVLDLTHPADVQRAWRIWEPHLDRFFRSFVKAGMHVVDVGAHHGTYTFLSSHLVGPTGHVTAVEPFPKSRLFLEQGVAVNGSTNVQILPYAASDKTQSVLLAYNSPHI
jgi:predicted methyltransferase